MHLHVSVGCDYEGYFLLRFKDKVLEVFVTQLHDFLAITGTRLRYNIQLQGA
jgi:hypothetical protein